MLQSLTFHKQKNLFNGVNQRFTPIIAVVFLAIALLIPQCINIGGVSVDYYYMLKDGGYLLDHPWSFPKSNVFSYIPGQKILFQQWGYMVLAAFLTRTFGNAIGTILLVDLSVALFVISFTWFFRLRKIPMSLSFLFAVLLEVIEPYHGVRPELLTIALLMLQICGLEQFCNVGEKVETLPFFRAKKWRWLLFLPFMTVLEMNLHGSMWIMHFVVVLPYLVQWLFHRRFHRQQYPRWYGIFLFLGMVSMIPCLFLNPYGIDGILYLPRSMKYLNQYGGCISELRSVTMPKQIGLIFFSPWVRVMSGVLLLTVFTVLSIEWNECEAIKQLVACFGRIVPRSELKVHSIERKKLHIGDFCMILGLTVLAWTKVRQTMWMDIAFAFLIAWSSELLRSKGSELMERHKVSFLGMDRRSIPLKTVGRTFKFEKSNNKLSFLVMALSALVLVTNTYTTNLNATFHPKDSIITPIKAVRWLNAHGKSKASILCCHDFGSYLQYKGFRVAMDSRPECYSKAIGGRSVAENIVPLYDMKSYHIRNADAYYHKITTLYRADYAIAYDRSDIFSYLIKNDPNYHAVVKGKGYILYECEASH